MAYLAEGRVPDAFGPFLTLEHELGFLPNLFRAQTLLPRVIEAEAEIAAAVLLKESALTRTRKECILLTVAAGNENAYCVAAHGHILRSLGVPGRQVDDLLTDYHQAGLAAADTALLDFTHKLSQLPTWIGRQDVERLRGNGFTDQAILEAVLVTALTQFLCTLSAGLGAEPDFENGSLPPRVAAPLAAPSEGFPSGHAREEPKRHLQAADLSPASFPPFAFFEARFGFVPNIFRSQTLRPDVVAAEARVVEAVLLREDVLSRARKEFILLAVSAANLNTYCVAVHVEMLRNLGVPEDVSDQIAIDHRFADLPAADKALLDFALKLARRPAEFSREDVEGLREAGLTDEQILEAVVMTALTMFLNTLQMGLGAVPDFEPARIFPRAGANLSRSGARPMTEAGTVSARGPGRDPDADWVERVQGGDVEAFEELVRRHHLRVYRTIIGITGRSEDVEDDLQNVFLKAYQNLGKFRGASSFATWLTRIAINEALERLRSRRKLESLDSESEDEEGEARRPRQVRAWADDAERLYTRQRTRELVEEAILGLPPKYRLVVLLRDIEQLSTEEAAAALGLGTATLKTRLLRGRMMLREALAPHFTEASRGSRV